MSGRDGPCNCGIGSCGVCRIKIGPDLQGHYCGCGLALCHECKGLEEEGGMKFEKLPLGLKLEVFKYLTKPDLLKSRLVSKTFPPRDLQVAVLGIFEENSVLDEEIISISIWLDLKPQPLSLESRVLAMCYRDYGEGDFSDLYDEIILWNNQVQPIQRRINPEDIGFNANFKINSLLAIPTTLLAKTRFLGLINDKSGKDFQECLELLVNNCREMRSIYLSGMPATTFQNFQSIFRNNQKLKRLFFEASEEENISFDLDCLNKSNKLKELTISYETKNACRLPLNLNTLIIFSGLPLEEIVWISRNLNPTHLSVRVIENVRNAAFLQTLADRDPSIYTLLGTTPPNDVANLPKFTHALFRDLLKSPFLEKLGIEIDLVVGSEEEMRNCSLFWTGEFNQIQATEEMFVFAYFARIIGEMKTSYNIDVIFHRNEIA